MYTILQSNSIKCGTTVLGSTTVHPALIEISLFSYRGPLLNRTAHTSLNEKTIPSKEFPFATNCTLVHTTFSFRL